MFTNMAANIEISSENWNLKVNHMDTLKIENLQNTIGDFKNATFECNRE